MNTSRTLITGAVVATMSLFSACGSTTTTTTMAPVDESPVPVSAQISSSYGVIDSIQVVQVETQKNNSGAGAVVGGLAGGLLGHQIGGGRGNTAATIAGAVGGAMVGNNVERNSDAPQVSQAYQIVVRMDSGAYETVTQNIIENMHVGSRVHVENGRAYPA